MLSQEAEKVLGKPEPRKRAAGSLPFNLQNKNRYSFQKVRDPNFGNSIVSDERKEFKIEGKLPASVVS